MTDLVAALPENRDWTEEERNAIRTLERLAKRWPKSLMLFSWSGTLHVMDREYVASLDVSGGQHPVGQNHSAASLITISIPNDGGDPDA